MPVGEEGGEVEASAERGGGGVEGDVPGGDAGDRVEPRRRRRRGGEALDAAALVAADQARNLWVRGSGRFR